MSGVKSSRSYVSPVRLESARTTRTRVLDAAQELFLAHGYMATTVDSIAAAAGVSKPTVFSSVGNKRVILAVLRDRALAGDDEEVPVAQRSWYQEALTEPDPHRALRLHARNIVHIQQRVAALDIVLERAAGADPELAELWENAQTALRTGASYVVSALINKGPLRAGLTKRTAIDILAVLTSSTTFHTLIAGSGWSTRRYETWLADLYCSQLLPA